MLMIEIALEIALRAHRGQKRLDGKAYVLHPIRMMTRTQDHDEQVLCLLHDVVEDSDIGFEDIQEFGFSSNIINALKAITHKTDEDYTEYIHRVANNYLATKVKILDIKDNLDQNEWPNAHTYLEKVSKYFNHLQILQQCGDDK
jgi:(p)ppGpp synthase/HD superfamily hydrolase